MRGVTVTLPPTAQVKLAKLNVSQMIHQDGVRAAQSRLSGLGRDPDPQVVAQLTRERDRHAERHRVLSLLINRLNQFMVELRLPAGAVLEEAPQIAIDVNNGQTGAAIETVRNDIKSVQQKMAAVKAAPLPQADQIGAAEAFVAKMASTAKPRVAVMRDGQIRVSWRDSVISGTDDVLSMLCWLQPEAVLSALRRDIEAQPTPINPMPADERIARVAELEQSLFELEQREEALILRAHSDGLEVLRRPESSPLAVLGLVIAKKARVPMVEIVA
jgi:hypothetical protein